MTQEKTEISAQEDAMWEAITGNDTEYLANPLNNPLMLGWHTLDTVLSTHLIPALEMLRTHRHGVPPILTSFDSIAPDEGMDRANELTWALVLDAMIEGFRAHLALDTTDYNVEGPDYYVLAKTRERGLTAFAEFFGHLWD